MLCLRAWNQETIKTSLGCLNSLGWFSYPSREADAMDTCLIHTELTSSLYGSRKLITSDHWCWKRGLKIFKWCMHYHVVEDQTKATHNEFHGPPEIFLFILVSYGIRLATANDLSPSRAYLWIAKWSLFLRSALVLQRLRICSGAPFAYSVPVSITIVICWRDWIRRCESL